MYKKTPKLFHLLSEQSCDKLKLPLRLEQRLTNEWTKQQVILMKENLQKKYRRVKFTGMGFAPTGTEPQSLKSEETVLTPELR